jgi:NAD(P)H-flavin reductase
MCQCVVHGDCALEIAVPMKERDAGAPAPRALAGTVSGLRRLTHDVSALDIDLEGVLDFEAGQFALLTVPGIVGPAPIP